MALLKLSNSIQNRLIYYTFWEQDQVPLKSIYKEPEKVVTSLIHVPLLHIMHVRYWIFCHVFLWRSSWTFPPQVILDEFTTKSHNCLTLMGIYRASAEFLTRYNLVNDTGQSTTELVREYFGTGRWDVCNMLRYNFSRICLKICPTI
jgi:hypothetical protein